MPKMPEVTVHVTTEPDPKELSEFKASAAMWEEQCRTLQRTLIDAQVEQDKLRDCASKFGTELILAKARVAELEAWQKEVANGLGFLNQPEGQAGYEVAEPSEIIHDWHECEAYTDRCRSALENIKRHIRESIGEENARFSTIYNIAAEATEG